MGTQTTASVSRRIIALDLIRGIFMLMIVVDHLNWGPSLFHLVSGGGMMFIGPAEGFFAISGILVGYIYGPRVAKSLWGATKKLWQRAWLLYALGVVFTLIYTVIAIKSHSAALPAIWQRDGASFIYNTLLGRYSYGWADFLPRYAVFMFIAPAILWLITRGKSWVVAAVSVGVYALFHTTSLLLPFSSWELIFIPAMIVGYYLPQIESFARRIPRKLTIGLWAFTAIVYLISISVTVVPSLFGHTSLLANISQPIAMLFDKETVGIGRYLLGIMLFWAMYSVVRRYEHAINKRTHGVLQVIGQKSLYTYGIHAFIVFFVTLLITPPANVTVFQSTVFASIILVVIYVAVISPALAKWFSFEYHKYLVSRILRYNQTYESS